MVSTTQSLDQSLTDMDTSHASPVSQDTSHISCTCVRTVVILCLFPAGSSKRSPAACGSSYDIPPAPDGDSSMHLCNTVYLDFRLMCGLVQWLHHIFTSLTYFQPVLWCPELDVLPIPLAVDLLLPMHRLHCCLLPCLKSSGCAWEGPHPVILCNQLALAALALVKATPAQSSHKFSAELQVLSQHLVRASKTYHSLVTDADTPLLM